MHINIEIKARCDDHDYVRKTLLAHHAEFRGEDHQIDTYFRCTNGRLKLREGNIENHLIHYDREDKEGPKQSNVTLYLPTPGLSLKSILEKSLGISAVVDKRREIYFIGNVKFHIDTVLGLGTFVEIEAIDKNGTIGVETLREQCAEYMRVLRITDDDLLKDSYSDMLVQHL
jgi:predicted adenylyl cyclase CyaB